MCFFGKEYAEEIYNSRGIYYYGKCIQKTSDGKRKSIQDERVKVLGSASYSKINVILKKSHNTLQYLTIPTCIDFKFISCTKTGSITHRDKEERDISAEILNIMVNGRRGTVTKRK